MPTILQSGHTSWADSVDRWGHVVDRWGHVVDNTNLCTYIF